MSAKLTASLLILAAILANLAFAALGSIFNYPDVLDEPAGKVLAAFRDSRNIIEIFCWMHRGARSPSTKTTNR